MLIQFNPARRVNQKRSRLSWATVLLSFGDVDFYYPVAENMFWQRANLSKEQRGCNELW